MGTRDTYQRVLIKACEIAGGETALAGQLGVPVPYVVNWLLGDSGHRQIPPDVFLAAVDIVLKASRQQVLETRTLLDAIRQRHRS